MDDKISKNYIDDIEIDKMIYEDKELYDNLILLKEEEEKKPKVVDVNADRISFALITIVVNVIQFLWNCRPPTGLESYRILDKKMTNIIINLVKDNNVRVYMFRADIVNAFNLGTPDIYYTDKIVKELRLTESELIGICLHEYGHFAGGHIKSINVTNTATGIVIPVLIRELSRDMDQIYSLALGKFIAYMVNSYLRIKMGRPQEYFSDSYATKKGYGTPLASALKKIDLYVRKIHCRDRSREECDTLIRNASRFDEHPTTEARLDNIFNSSKINSLLSSKRFELLVRFLNRIKEFFGR